MHRRVVALIGVVLLVLLAFLAGGLRGTEFHGGHPLPSSGSAGLVPAFPPNTISSADWMIDILRIFLFCGVLLATLALLFSRKFRRQALHLLIGLGVFLLLWHYLLRSPYALRTPPASEEISGGAPAEGSGESMDRVPSPPRWAVYLAAVVVGVGMALWLGPRLGRTLERKRIRRAIQEVAQEAKVELVQGSAVSDVVIRAWLQMVEILSRRCGAQDRPSFTPREFAESMAKLGFKHEAVDVLTKLFEEVRYGRKESEPRRDQALAALAALEKAHAQS